MKNPLETELHVAIFFLCHYTTHTQTAKRKLDSNDARTKPRVRWNEGNSNNSQLCTELSIHSLIEPQFSLLQSTAAAVQSSQESKVHSSRFTIEIMEIASIREMKSELSITGMYACMLAARWRVKILLFSIRNEILVQVHAKLCRKSLGSEGSFY